MAEILLKVTLNTITLTPTMLSVLAPCVIDLVFHPRSGQAKDENMYLLYIR